MANLVFHQGALGDWVLTFGLLRAMPAPTTAVTHWSKAQLAARRFAHVEPLDIELREFTRLHAEGGPAFLSPAVESMLANTDTVLSFVSRGDDAWADNLRKLAPNTRHLFVFPRPPEDFTGHVWDWHAQQLEKQGLLIEQQIAPAAMNRAGPVVIHPGSGGEAKCWPADRYLATLHAMRQEGRQVTVLIGDVERERWAGERLRQFQEVATVIEPRTLLELADTLEHASLYLGNDSGPTHLAAELGVPTIAMFGPSHARHWSPRGSAVRLLAPPEPQSMDWLSVDRVLDACRECLA